MTNADRIAVRIKFVLHHFASVGIRPSRILLGHLEWRAIVENSNPCDPPDFVPDGERPSTFCGVEACEVPCYATLIAYEFN